MPRITARGGFERCPRCGTMRGPVPACPRCGWAVSCAWCSARVLIPGRGWELMTGPVETCSHGMCPWCMVRQYGGDPAVVAYAAEHLGVPAGLLTVRKRTLTTGTVFLVVHYDGVTGWAGLARKVEAMYGM